MYYPVLFSNSIGLAIKTRRWWWKRVI